MNKRVPYSYSILRYVHDVATGEFVNVGVVVHSPELGILNSRCRVTFKRISEFFPNLDSKAFKGLMRQMNARMRELSDSYADTLNINPQRESLDSLLKKILPFDDSSLRWTPPSGGVSGDVDALLGRLFDRYVSKYDVRIASNKRSDADVWRNFSRELEKRHINGYFSEHTVAGQDDEMKFQSAWKNGMWHCVEPLSFDLAASDSIKEKARHFLGQMTSISDTQEKVQLYIILAKPSDPELADAYQHAVQIIGKSGFQQEVYTEEEFGTLAQKFQQKIAEHENKIFH